jgi:hypothetical protein
MNTEEEKIGDKLEGFFGKAKAFSLSSFEKAEIRQKLEAGMSEEKALPASSGGFSWQRLVAPMVFAFVVVLVLVNKNPTPGSTGSTQSLEAPSFMKASSQKAPSPEAYGAVQNFYAADSVATTSAETRLEP